MYNVHNIVMYSSHVPRTASNSFPPVFVLDLGFQITLKRLPKIFKNSNGLYLKFLAYIQRVPG